MPKDERPVVVAYDGSPTATAALRTAVELFGDRTLLITSVWEPAIAMLSMSVPDPSGFTYMPPDPEDVATVDRVEHDHAAALADAGVAMARGLGADARPVARRDDTHVAEALLAVADGEDAAAIVVGSRGLGGLRSRMEGSVSRRLLHDSGRPVLVVREAR